jgi:hypothetical protein
MNNHLDIPTAFLLTRDVVINILRIATWAKHCGRSRVWIWAEAYQSVLKLLQEPGLTEGKDQELTMYCCGGGGREKDDVANTATLS